MIINGQIPGRFVWEDQTCVVFATIEPTEPGHVLVVPRAEVDKYSDLAPEVFAHLANVAQIIGRAQEQAFNVPRSIISILVFDVPHTHIHVIPATAQTVAKIGKETQADDAQLDTAMEKLRKALCDLGYADHVPPELGKLNPEPGATES